MKGLGNYRRLPTAVPPTQERRLGMVVGYQGPRVTVRFVDGQTYSMPADPFRKLVLAENERFVMVTVYVGRQVRDVRIERAPDARPMIAGRPLPKVYMRDGLKVATRR